MQAIIWPRTFSAGFPNIVASTTSGSVSPIFLTSSNVMRRRGMVGYPNDQRQARLVSLLLNRE